MKALVFYTSMLLSALLLCLEFSIVWLVILTIDILLVSWLYNNITLQEFIKYSGYKAWYKMINGYS